MPLRPFAIQGLLVSATIVASIAQLGDKATDACAAQADVQAAGCQLAESTAKPAHSLIQAKAGVRSKHRRNVIWSNARGAGGVHGKALATKTAFGKQHRSHTPHVSAAATRGWGMSPMTTQCCAVSVAGAAALLLAVFLWKVPVKSGDSSSSVPSASAERLCLLDNAKVSAQFLVIFNHFLYYSEVGEYVDGKTWLSGSEPLLKTLMYGIRMVMMPAICFISGVCSQGAVTQKKQQRYVQYLVAPTLLWVCCVKPVLIDTLMTLQPDTLWTKLRLFGTLQAFHEEWYLQALTTWRGLSYLLWAHVHPAVAFFAMMLLSCGGGYYNFSSGAAWFLKLSETLGFLPYFAVGYIFPFHAVCRSIPKPRNIVSVLVAAMVVVWVFFIVPMIFPDPLPDGHGSYHCCEAKKAFESATELNLRFYWTRRLAKTAVEMPAMLAMLFLVLPRGQTPLTWVGPHTLYPFLFHLLAHTWRSRLLSKLPLPIVTSMYGHLLVLALQIPYCLAVIAFFASPFWRWLFGWCLSPDWLQPLIAGTAERAEVPAAKKLVPPSPITGNDGTPDGAVSSAKQAPAPKPADQGSEEPQLQPAEPTDAPAADEKKGHAEPVKPQIDEGARAEPPQ